MKSDTCFSKKTNQPLSVYSSIDEANAAAEYEKVYRGIEFFAYKCEKCQLYHLAPEESRINVMHNACSCRDSNGNPKALYFSWNDAKKQQGKSQEEQDILLEIYECPERLGFHLTHNINHY